MRLSMLAMARDQSAARRRSRRRPLGMNAIWPSAGQHLLLKPGPDFRALGHSTRNDCAEEHFALVNGDIRHALQPNELVSAAARPTRGRARAHAHSDLVRQLAV